MQFPALISWNHHYELVWEFGYLFWYLTVLVWSPSCLHLPCPYPLSRFNYLVPLTLTYISELMYCYLTFYQSKESLFKVIASLFFLMKFNFSFKGKLKRYCLCPWLRMTDYNRSVITLVQISFRWEIHSRGNITYPGHTRQVC